jgi:type II restriction enzyme
MQLQMRSALGNAYKSAPQKARVISEDWAEANLYCPACTSDVLKRQAANTKSLDFKCPACTSRYELKCSVNEFGGSIPDGAYEAMRSTIEGGHTPNLFTLHYNLATWTVEDLAVVPSFTFTLTCLQKRRPLAPTARRAGWVGCNILLRNIPLDVRISVVKEGVSETPEKVRKQFRKLQPLATMELAQRGWSLDVLNVVRSLSCDEFRLEEVYQYTDALQKLHPDNRHVRDKIRQQLQVLRDLKLLEFIDNRGTYRLPSRP